MSRQGCSWRVRLIQANVQAEQPAMMSHRMTYAYVGKTIALHRRLFKGNMMAMRVMPLVVRISDP